MAGKGKGTAKTAKKQAAPTTKTTAKKTEDAPLTPAQLGHHVPPTGDRRKRYRKD